MSKYLFIEESHVAMEGIATIFGETEVRRPVGRLQTRRNRGFSLFHPIETSEESEK